MLRVSRALLLSAASGSAFRLGAPLSLGQVNRFASATTVPPSFVASRSLCAHFLPFFSLLFSGLMPRGWLPRNACAPACARHLCSATAHYAGAVLRRVLYSSGIRASADDLEAQIKSTVTDTKVVVYSKSWCPFCQKTKALFDGLSVEYTAIELDQLDEGAAIQETLLAMTGQRTVPSVFVGGQHLGGNDDTQKAAASGKLQEMLK